MKKSLKPSGVDWIGDVPVGWGIRRVKDIGKVSGGGVDKIYRNEDIETYMVNYLDVYKSRSKQIIPAKSLMLTTATRHQLNSASLKINDILLTPSSETSDDIGHAACIIKGYEFNLVFSYHLTRIRPLSFHVFPSYLVYLINSHGCRNVLASVSGGTTRKTLTHGDIERLLVVLPEVTEQIAIAAYLDKTTAAIDEQKALLKRKKELLLEHKKALIHKAVTKGLDDSVPMKESGVDWIGEVPVGWEVARVKDSTKLIMGQSPDSEFVTDQILLFGIPFLQGCSDFGKLHPNPNMFCSKYAKSSNDGDILFSVRAPVGKTNISNGQYVIGRGLCALRPKRTTTSFLNWIAQSVIAPSMSEKVTGSTFEAVSISDIKSAFIPFPLLPEQIAIAAYLDMVTAVIDQQWELIDQKIYLLTDLRASVIHEAVTKGIPAAA